MYVRERARAGVCVCAGAGVCACVCVRACACARACMRVRKVQSEGMRRSLREGRAKKTGYERKQVTTHTDGGG